MTDSPTVWDLWRKAARLLAVDPAGLGGAWLKLRAGPVARRVTDGLGAAMAPLPPRKLHVTISDEALYGGVDLTATLTAGRKVLRGGLMTGDAAFLLPMAERCPVRLAARLGGMLDGQDKSCLIALDEGIEADETLPAALSDRLAFHLTLDGVRLADCPEFDVDVAEARAQLADVDTSHAAETLTTLASHMGIDSLRAPLMAVKAARAHAALAGREVAGDEDISAAAALVLAPRAVRWPETAEDEDDHQPPSEPSEESADKGEGQDQMIPPEMVLEAMKAHLPEGLLAQLQMQAARRAAKGAGAGARSKGNRRGRPMAPRMGRLSAQTKVDVIATLRTAAPWQTVRRRQTPDHPARVLIRPDDIRIKRFEEKSDRVLIFSVDASGSAALARLAEAKGAIELLLSEAYVNRDHVALIAFRGEQAELLLPPTRSLVQAKRRLAALPGGGGTPLASALRSAYDLAGATGKKGMTPTLAFLTDGRGNIALDGKPDRQAAEADMEGWAQAIRARAIPSIVIDTGNRPQRRAEALSRALGGAYLPMPRADAKRLSEAISTTLVPAQ